MADYVDENMGEFNIDKDDSVYGMLCKVFIENPFLAEKFLTDINKIRRGK